MSTRIPTTGLRALFAAGMSLLALALIGSASAAGATAPDPVASGKVSFKVTKGFKKTLKRNRVHMGPRNFAIKPGPSKIDPVTGTGKVSLKGKLKFRGHGKRVVARKLVAKIGDNGGNLKGVLKGRKVTLLRLRSKPGKGAKVTRVGFGATLSRISARLGKRLAKAVNRKLGLHSLVTSRRLAKVTVGEQPKTVAITGGEVFVDIPAGYLPTSALGPNQDPNTVAAKQPAHCIGPAGGVSVIPGGDPNNPARLSTALAPDPVLGPPPTGVAARFRFPVTGGTVSPAGKDGVIQVIGGVRLSSGEGGVDAALFPQPAACDDADPGPATSHSILDTTNLAPNLGQLNVQADTTIAGTTPGCNGTGAACGPAILAGPKGIAIGQSIDPSGITVSADPNAKTVKINGGLIRNNATATTVLNGLFPNASGDSAMNFADGDKFGVSSVTVSTR